MTPNDVIAKLVQSHGGLCVLDQLHLPYSQPSSGPAAKFGLGAELYLPDIDRAELRERAVQFLVDYGKTFPAQVTEFLKRDHRRTVKFRGDLAQLITADCDKHAIETGYDGELFGFMDIGLRKDDVPPFQGYAVAKRAQYRQLSYFGAQFPVCDGVGNSNSDLLLASVLRWCRICRPNHGCAGFTLIFAAGMQQNTLYALQMMKRFPGFDFQDGGSFCTEAATVHNRIKCVNWLTILNDELVVELGGLIAMRKALEPLCKVHEYLGGVVIQAGAYPQLGDTYCDNIPEAYRLVSRYTKSIRFEGYKDTFFSVADGLDDVAEALAWVRRFD